MKIEDPEADNVKVVSLDTRRMTPPQPLAEILEAAKQPDSETELRALTERYPTSLHLQLSVRGFIAETQPRTDGSFITYIRCRTSSHSAVG